MQSMNKINLRLPSPLVEKIKIGSEKNKQNFSGHLRYLVELGLRVEEIQNSPESERPQRKLEALVYKSVLESVMLMRGITRNLNHLEKEKQENYIRQAKEIAANTVKSFLGEECLEED